MKRWHSITIASLGFKGIEIINEIYGLGYRPDQLKAIVPKSNRNDIFEKFCSEQKIDISHVDADADMMLVPTTDVLLSVGGLPFLLSSGSRSRFRVTVNLHTGLTQISRGRWQSSWAIIQGWEETGYTWHHMNQEFDAGNIILQEKIKILPNDTALSLNAKIFKSAFQNLAKVLDECSGVGIKQEKLGRYYSKMKPYQGKIDPSWTNDGIERFIRAMYHPPHEPAMFGDRPVPSYQKYLALCKQDKKNQKTKTKGEANDG